MLRKGSNLHPKDREFVLSAYVHRFTGSHKPAWARSPAPNGMAYPCQFKDDADWLENTVFHVRKDGRLDKRVRECQSTSTWPDRKAFIAA